MHISKGDGYYRITYQPGPSFNLCVWFSSDDAPMEFTLLDPGRDCPLSACFFRDICLDALNEVNEFLGTAYSFAKVEYRQSDSMREDVFRVMICKLVQAKLRDDEKSAG